MNFLTIYNKQLDISGWENLLVINPENPHKSCKLKYMTTANRYRIAMTSRLAVKYGRSLEMLNCLRLGYSEQLCRHELPLMCLNMKHGER